MSDSSSTEWVYGLHTVQALLKTDGERVKELRLQRGRKDLRQQKIQALAGQQDIPWLWASRKELDALLQDHNADDEEINHQGVAALCTAGVVHDEPYLFSLLNDLPRPALLLVLDEVTDPHNLGACLRTADAAGVNAIITTKDRSVGITPVVRKVASGAADSVPLVVVTNLARTLNKLKEQGLWIIGTDGDAEADVYQADFTGALALVMGAEGKGLRRLTKETCDSLVKLPMAGTVSSLNVSVAAGVCLFEAVRQRQSGS